jgi:alpha-N-arabinofuranosidase
VNRIKIDLDRQRGPINPRIYGNFIEHLGGCIYGGIFDEGNPRSDADGFRLDVLEAVKRLAPTVLRYPGGNFASGYHWLDGVGPRDSRPRRIERAWHTVESNRFGTDEFIKYTRLVGAEPCICVNLGTGTLDEAANWVEYCNGAPGTYYADMRAANGHPEPYNVKIWDLGNEMDGDWQIGHKTAEEYARVALECAKMMKWTDSSIQLVACGDSFPLPHWNRIVLEHLDGWADYISVHLYVNRGDMDAAGYLVHCYNTIESRISRVEAQIAAAAMRKPVAISFDEWGIGLPRGRQYTLADGLVAAIYLNAFLRHPKTVTMANYAQLVNVIPNITASRDDIFLQATFFPIELYRHHSRGVSLDVWVGCPNLESEGRTAPVLDVTAAYDQQSRSVTVNVVNMHPTDDVEATIECQTGGFAGVANIFVMNASSVEDSNSFENKEKVQVKALQEAMNGDKVPYRFPAHSLTVMKMFLY